jgi:hypothetical protein
VIPAAAESALAIHGGEPVRRAPYPSWPYFAEDEIAAVTAVMRSGRVNYWTGEQGRSFEREFAEASACKHAVAVANGTAALELALHALEIPHGAEVITSSRTYVASASCILRHGGLPVFADVDRDTQNITADTIRAVITRKARAIIVVHLAGWPCDMDSILEVAREHDLFIIEDCAQAQGATYKGRPVGSFGDAAAFSFCQDKIMTTLGEGGMLVTNDAEVWKRAWACKDHGKSYDAVHQRQHPPGFRWLHESIGTNWRMTEAQAAVGRAQLKKVPEWVGQRQAHAQMLNTRLSPISALRVPRPDVGAEHCYYKYGVFVRPERLKDGWHRDRVIDAIQAEGVPCSVGSCGEIYLEKVFEGVRPAQRLPVARELGETSLMFPVHPTLETGDIEDTCEAISKVMAEGSQ